MIVSAAPGSRAVVRVEGRETSERAGEICVDMWNHFDKQHILSGDYQCWVVDFARRSLACSCSTLVARELGQQGRGGRTWL